VDVDAHHGDGVQAAFYRRKDVLTISLHESGHTLFPGTGFEDELGQDAGWGYNVNVPLPADTYDEAFLRAFEEVAVPVLEMYRPDAVVLELGMDGLAGDPLTHMALTNNAYVEALKRLLSLGRPMLVAGGGGYHVENTVRGWALAWQALCGTGEEDLGLALGGVMLASTEWAGGLRDHARPVSPEQRRAVEPALRRTIDTVTQGICRCHGLEMLRPKGCGSVAGA
jgi:acetoin utilization protein AcuC